VKNHSFFWIFAFVIRITAMELLHRINNVSQEDLTAFAQTRVNKIKDFWKRFNETSEFVVGEPKK
jgi:hypothetical protein